MEPPVFTLVRARSIPRPCEAQRATPRKHAAKKSVKYLFTPLQSSRKVVIVVRVALHGAPLTMNIALPMSGQRCSDGRSSCATARPSISFCT